jgi:hypothetical protein
MARPGETQIFCRRPSDLQRLGMANTKPVLRWLAGSWGLIGIAGMATLASSGVFSGSIAPWVALAIFLLLVVIGGFGAAGKFWAQVCLLLPVFVVFLYASDVCFAYFAHARFTAYFWNMLAVAMWSLITGLVTLRTETARCTFL